MAGGRHGLTLLAEPLRQQKFAGSISATLAVPKEEGALPSSLVPLTGSRLEVGGAQLEAGDLPLPKRSNQLALSAKCARLRLIVHCPGRWGWLSAQHPCPAEGMQANLDLGLAWSTEPGLTLRGSRQPRCYVSRRPVPSRRPHVRMIYLGLQTRGTAC